jgi:hypothetical protein
MTFDGCLFRSHEILPAFPVQLSGKKMEVDFEVVDVPLDYNLLLGNNWTYAMTVVVSSILHTLCFPHEGKIVTIDQLSFVHAIPNASFGPSIHMIENSQPTIEDIGVGM